MKKISILTVSFLAFNIGFLNAQTQKGGFLVGLYSDMFDLGYTTMKYEYNTYENDTKYFNFNLSPKVGYFVIDNLAVGIDLDFGFTLFNDRNNTTTISAGPFARYYIPTSKVLPFLELGGSIGSSGDNTTVNYGGGIGLAVPLGGRVMADLLAGYHHGSSKDRESSNDMSIKTGRIGLELGFTILLGSN
jgi:hypothetical protein